MSKFKKELSDHYSKFELEPEFVSSLQDGKKYKVKASFGIFQWLTLAVGICFMLMLFKPWEKLTYSQEVVKNHIKNMPVEVNSNSVIEVAKVLNKIEFQAMDIPPVKGAILMGGRYCHLGGVTALQLSYKGPQGKRITVYQVGKPKDIDMDEGSLSQESINGVNVEMKVKDGLLIGIAQ